jgi:hypothetical protein
LQDHRAAACRRQQVDRFERCDIARAECHLTFQRHGDFADDGLRVADHGRGGIRVLSVDDDLDVSSPSIAHVGPKAGGNDDRCACLVTVDQPLDLFV